MNLEAAGLFRSCRYRCGVDGRSDWQMRIDVPLRLTCWADGAKTHCVHSPKITHDILLGMHSRVSGRRISTRRSFGIHDKPASGCGDARVPGAQGRQTPGQPRRSWDDAAAYPLPFMRWVEQGTHEGCDTEQVDGPNGRACTAPEPRLDECSYCPWCSCEICGSRKCIPY